MSVGQNTLKGSAMDQESIGGRDSKRMEMEMSGVKILNRQDSG